MKLRGKWVVAVALAVGSCPASGCQPTGPELGPPASVLTRYASAVHERDNAAMVACWDPRMHAELRKALDEWDVCEEKVRDLKAALEKHLSPRLAKRFRWNLRSTFLYGEPLYGACRGGRVNWWRVRLRRREDLVEVRADGELQDLVIRRVQGNWYLSEMEIPKDGIACFWARWGAAKSYANEFERNARDIRNGTLTEKNIVWKTSWGQVLVSP